jgi:transcriptional regulator with XRE-family HTH domain
MGIGTIIKKARKSCGLTQGVLATRACMAQSIVSAIESGTRNPTLRTLKRLAKALELRLVVRLENANGSGYEWSTPIEMAKRVAGFAGTPPNEQDRMPLSEPASRDSGLEPR